MRLTCPNCAAAYEVSDTLVPAGGRHVQCTACHTRWFEKPSPAVAPSEDQILRRLESRGARLVAVPSSPPPSPSADAAPLVEAPDPGVTLVAVPDAEAGVAVEAAAPEPEAKPEPEAQAEPALEAGEPDRGAEVADTSAVAQPAGDPPRATGGDRQPPDPASAASSVAHPGTGAGDAPPAGGRPALRLDLTGMPADATGLRTRNRFGRGLLMAAMIAALAAGAYLSATPLAARIPPLEPALAAYVAFVDDLRASIAALRPETPDPQD